MLGETYTLYVRIMTIVHNACSHISQVLPSCFIANGATHYLQMCTSSHSGSAEILYVYILCSD